VANSDRHLHVLAVFVMPLIVFFVALFYLFFVKDFGLTTPLLAFHAALAGAAVDIIRRTSSSRI